MLTGSCAEELIFILFNGPGFYWFVLSTGAIPGRAPACTCSLITILPCCLLIVLLFKSFSPGLSPASHVPIQPSVHECICLHWLTHHRMWMYRTATVMDTVLESWTQIGSNSIWSAEHLWLIDLKTVLLFFSSMHIEEILTFLAFLYFCFIMVELISKAPPCQSVGDWRFLVQAPVQTNLGRCSGSRWRCHYTFRAQ